MSGNLNFPLLRLSPGMEALRADVRAFLADCQAKGVFEAEHSWGSRYNFEFSRALGKAGYIGMTWPKEYGGHGRSMLERYVVTEELLAAGAPVGPHWTADRQSGPVLLRYGSEEQKRDILPRIVAGECYFCIGMSEPDSGSDLASVRTRATRTDGGWLLNGTKLWTSGAHICHYMIALVRTEAPSDDRHAGMTQMLIDLKNSKGLEIRPVINLAGHHHFNEEIFTDCFVPDDMVIGNPGDGWKQVMGELSYERSGPERFLSTFRLFRELVDAIGPNPTPEQAKELGRMYAELVNLRQMSMSVAGLLNDGKLPNSESAIVKDLGTNFAQILPEHARLMVGPGTVGDNASYDEALAHATMYAPSFTIQGGTREVLRGMIARELGLR